MYKNVQTCTFSIKLELLENGSEECRIYLHGGLSYLHQPTFQSTAPEKFRSLGKYRTQVNILRKCYTFIYNLFLNLKTGTKNFL